MKAGIVADNYKVPAFEQELTAAGLSYDKSPFTKTTTTIRVVFNQPKELEKIRAICTRVQGAAHRKSQGEN